MEIEEINLSNRQTPEVTLLWSWLTRTSSLATGTSQPMSVLSPPLPVFVGQFGLWNNGRSWNTHKRRRKFESNYETVHRTFDLSGESLHDYLKSKNLDSVLLNNQMKTHENHINFFVWNRLLIAIEDK